MPNELTPTRGRGQPKKYPPEGAAKLIEDLAADGFSVVGCAARMGVSRHTFENWLKEDERLQEAFAAGRERERYTLHNRLYRIAVEEDAKVAMIAAMFLLKSRHSYREGDQTQGADARVHVTVNLPGAMSREDYLKSVIADDGNRKLADDTLPASRDIRPRRA